jgi:hypothetical protein
MNPPPSSLLLQWLLQHLQLYLWRCLLLQQLLFLLPL